MILTGILRNTRHIRETFYLILYHDADFKSHLTLMPADCSVIRTETSLFRGRMEFTMKETDKRLEANRLVKLRIARALTKLMEKKNFSDFRKAFSLNDRFRFRRELFGGDEARMNKVINDLNDLHSYEDSVTYLNNELKWNIEDEAVADFIKLLEKRFL